jgi:hypothetical protein
MRLLACNTCVDLLEGRLMVPCAYYFDSGDINSVREMGLFCAEIPSKV